MSFSLVSFVKTKNRNNTKIEASAYEPSESIVNATFQHIHMDRHRATTTGNFPAKIYLSKLKEASLTLRSV